MKGVKLYAEVRYAVQIEGVSRREAARRFGIDPRTVAKMLAFSVPPGYRRSRPPARPKLDPFTGIIDRILTEDEGRPKKQRHTSKRIFERLRDANARISVRAGSSSTLESEGYAVDVASTLAQARGLVDALRYSLVIADLHLPDGNGLEILDQAMELA
jgi:hypothetical protein